MDKLSTATQTKWYFRCTVQNPDRAKATLSVPRAGYIDRRPGAPRARVPHTHNVSGRGDRVRVNRAPSTAAAVAEFVGVRAKDPPRVTTCLCTPDSARGQETVRGRRRKDFLKAEWTRIYVRILITNKNLHEDKLCSFKLTVAIF